MMLEISELSLPAIVIQILQSIKELVCHTFYNKKLVSQNQCWKYKTYRCQRYFCHPDQAIAPTGNHQGCLAYHHHLLYIALSWYSHGFYNFQSTSFFLHQIFKTTFTLPQNLLAFCRPVQKHFLSTSLSKICIFFCLSILNVLLLYLTSNYFTFCLPPLVLPHLFFN